MLQKAHIFLNISYFTPEASASLGNDTKSRYFQLHLFLSIQKEVQNKLSSCSFSNFCSFEIHGPGRKTLHALFTCLLGYKDERFAT